MPIRVAVKGLKEKLSFPNWMSPDQIKAAILGSGLIATEDDTEASFIGKAAKTFSDEALQLARKMTDEGASRNDIWKATGEQFGKPTFKDVDGHWKQEIDDSRAVPTEVGKKEKFATWMGDAIKNDELYQAYPSLKDMDVTAGYYNKGESGSYTPATPDDNFNFGRTEEISIGGSNNKSVLSHELQHAVQEREGFAKGGNVGEFSHSIDLTEGSQNLDDLLYTLEMSGADLSWYRPSMFNEKSADSVFDDLMFSGRNNNPITKEEAKTLSSNIPSLKGDLEGKDWSTVIEALADDAYEEITPKLGLDPMQQYKRLAGEAEARNVEKRLTLPLNERIKNPPWNTLDVPEKELIIRGVKGLGAASMLAGGTLSAQDLMLGDPLTKSKTQTALRSDDKSFTELGDDFIADKLMQMGITTPERAQDSAEFINMLLGATGSYGGAQLGSDVGEGARWLQNYLSKDGHEIDWSEYE